MSYGTSSLVRRDLEVTKVHTDAKGLDITFNAAGCTWYNFYIPYGSSCEVLAKREEYFSLKIPQLLVRRLAQGMAGGDLNSIIAI